MSVLRLASVPCGLTLAALALSGCSTADAPSDLGPGAADVAIAQSSADMASQPAPTDQAGAPDLLGPCGACIAPTPKCDEAARRCVECLAHADCPNDKVCVQRACRPGCAPGHTICGDAGACDVDMGVCRGCVRDAECRDPNAPVCDLASGRCAPCSLKNDACPAGSYCAVGGAGLECVPGCKRDFDCMAGRDASVHVACCNHVCVDTWSAPGDCGACGQACGPGSDCCDGQCADVRSDVAHCGGCGIVCPANNTIATCVAGVCGKGGCVIGFADCDQNAANGCEVDVKRNVAHCGGCAQACSVPNASPACNDGVCAIAACAMGFRNCNAMLVDGCEVNSASDPSNCGNCGNGCKNVAHASAGCAAGMCTVGVCEAGWGNCNQKPEDGCESQFAATALHCGGCGMACPLPPNHVGATCVNAVCGAGGCQVAWGDCDNNPGNGCEADLNLDVANCGACGKACMIGQICQQGACVSGDFGAGGDGTLTVANGQTTTVNATASTASGTAGQSSLTVGNSGGFKAGNNILIHQTQGKDAGRWEMAIVTDVGQGKLTLLGQLKNSYASAGSDHAQAVLVPQHTDVTVNQTGTLTAPPWNGTTGGILVVQAMGKLSIAGSATMDGRGFRGSKHGCLYQCQDGISGESPTGAGLTGKDANGSGGGGGLRGQDCAEGGGGGYGTMGGNGDNGTQGNCAPSPHSGGSGGGTTGDADLSKAILFGGAGGEGGGDEDGAYPGNGGNGGGIVILLAATLSVNGTVSSAGSNGGDGNNVDCGSAGCGMSGGGGGAGGAIRLLANDATLGNNQITARGGVGGACTCGGSGAAGGVGRIALKAKMKNGATDPAPFDG